MHRHTYDRCSETRDEVSRVNAPTDHGQEGGENRGEITRYGRIFTVTRGSATRPLLPATPPWLVCRFSVRTLDERRCRDATVRTAHAPRTTERPIRVAAATHRCLHTRGKGASPFFFLSPVLSFRLSHQTLLSSAVPTVNARIDSCPFFFPFSLADRRVCTYAWRRYEKNATVSRAPRVQCTRATRYTPNTVRPAHHDIRTYVLPCTPHRHRRRRSRRTATTPRATPRNVLLYLDGRANCRDRVSSTCRLDACSNYLTKFLCQNVEFNRIWWANRRERGIVPLTAERVLACALHALRRFSVARNSTSRFAHCRRGQKHSPVARGRHLLTPGCCPFGSVLY